MEENAKEVVDVDIVHEQTKDVIRDAVKTNEMTEVEATVAWALDQV